MRFPGNPDVPLVMRVCGVALMAVGVIHIIIGLVLLTR